MNNKTIKFLVPSYVKKFKCIGNKCEDTCCMGWSIDIDKDTYKKYKKSSDAELKNKLKDSISRHRSSQTKIRYAKIKLDNTLKCPFLNDNLLCDVHGKMGEKFLSVTCASYPRYYSKIKENFEKFMTVSCPEVARLALLNPEGINFYEEYEEVDLDRIAVRDINLKGFNRYSKIDEYFDEIRTFCVQILKSRDYEIWERLIIIGLLCKEIDENDKNKEGFNIAETIEKYTGMIVDGEFKAILQDIPSSTMIQIKLIKELADERIVKGINSKRFAECFAEMLLGLDFNSNRKLEEINNTYNEICEIYYKPFIEQKGYIIENYLVNYVFFNLFPVKDGLSIFDNYVMLVVHYAFIKLQLIGMMAFHKDSFNEDYAVKLIQSFSKTIEHNSEFESYMYKLLKENGYNNISYMAILIKN